MGNMNLKKRKDECFKCNSRSCYYRIYNTTFDEIACVVHSRDLEKYANEILGKSGGVMRRHVSSIHKQKRGHYN